MRRLALMILAILGIFGSIITGMSNFYASTDPALATGLNSWNSSAHKIALLEIFQDMEPQKDPKLLIANAQKLIRHAPLESRGYSILAEGLSLLKREDEARRSRSIALSLAPTDPVARFHQFAQNVSSGNHLNALRDMDALLRKNPAMTNAVTTILHSLPSDEEATRMLMEMLLEDPPWRPQFMGALQSLPGSEEQIYSINLQLHQAGVIDLAAIDRTISLLLGKKRTGLAHRLFLFTQRADERQANGYIFNSDFSLPPTQRILGWQVSDAAGSGARWQRNSSSESGELRVHFSGQPVRRINVRQTLILYPGRYKFQSRYTTRQLELPKGLDWVLTCRTDRKTIFRLAVDQGTSSEKKLGTEFSVGNACEVFDLSLETRSSSNSFRYRYSGTLDVGNAKITKIGS